MRHALVMSQDIALFTFGCTALMVDGESLSYFTTLPRYETLLFWLPATLLLTTTSERQSAASQG